MHLLTKSVHKKRESLTALPLYHSGHLHKKLSKEKDFKKYYAELRGVSLFLYKNDSQEAYIEKLDLEQLKSMELDSPYQKDTPSTFTLKLPTEDVQLKMDDADTGEVWRGYIMTVVRKEVPSHLQLLPGHIYQLQDTLAQEKKRKAQESRPPIPNKPPPTQQHSVSSDTCSSATEDKSTSEMPECFLKVTRQEAEKLLEDNPEYGGIILRPSTMANNYALTLRLLTPSGPVMKNYRVTSTKSGFVIELETTVTVSTLNDVLKYFLEKTEYRLCPYAPSQSYATRIEAVPAPNPVVLQSMSEVEFPPPPEMPEPSEYENPDNHDPKQSHLDSEKQKLDFSSEEDNTYSKQLP